MADVITQEIKLPRAGAEVQFWITRPEASEVFPAVVLLHGVGGPGQHYRDACDRFAREGIVGVLFNHMARGQDPPDADILGDLDACVVYLQQQPYIKPEQVAIGGYCRGGTLAMLALGQSAAFSAGVIFHGLPFYRDGVSEARPRHAYDLADRVEAPMLIIHGASDTTSPLDGVFRYAARLNELGKRFELKVYSGTEHAFTMPGGGRGGARYHPENADDAFREAVLFLGRVHRTPVGDVAPIAPVAA